MVWLNRRLSKWVGLSLLSIKFNFVGFWCKAVEKFWFLRLLWNFGLPKLKELCCWYLFMCWVWLPSTFRLSSGTLQISCSSWNSLGDFGCWGGPLFSFWGSSSRTGGLIMSSSSSASILDSNWWLLSFRNSLTLFVSYCSANLNLLVGEFLRSFLLSVIWLFVLVRDFFVGGLLLEQFLLSKKPSLLLYFWELFWVSLKLESLISKLIPRLSLFSANFNFWLLSVKSSSGSNMLLGLSVVLNFLRLLKCSDPITLFVGICLNVLIPGVSKALKLSSASGGWELPFLRLSCFKRTNCFYFYPILSFLASGSILLDIKEVSFSFGVVLEPPLTLLLAFWGVWQCKLFLVLVLLV